MLFDRQVFYRHTRKSTARTNGLRHTERTRLSTARTDRLWSPAGGVEQLLRSRIQPQLIMRKEDFGLACEVREHPAVAEGQTDMVSLPYESSKWTMHSDYTP